jgi:DNA-binding response OmpR family regulator
MHTDIKVLIVEDETIVGLDIQSTLKQLRFQVTNMVTNYQDALQSARMEVPDVLLTDIHLEGSKSGIEISKDIQSIAHIPTIFLTAYSDETTINEAIKANPIGYITKPFKREDIKSNILLAKYKITKHNQANISKNHKNLGFGFYFDEKNKLLFYDDIPIRLSPKEKELLHILISAKGNIVSFSTLENFIWPGAPVSNSTLRTLIYRLRSKLEYKLITTIPSIGCKLTPQI